MKRYLHLFVLALILIFPAPVPAQIELVEAVDGEQEAIDLNQRAENTLRQLGLATIACQLDTDYADRKCWVTKEHDERTVLGELYVFGLRLDPDIGLAVISVRGDEPDTYALVAVAAPNSIGAPVYIYLPDQEYGKVARLVDLKELPINFTVALNIYDNNSKSPAGFNISAPRLGLTYDLKTALVTAVAP